MNTGDFEKRMEQIIRAEGTKAFNMPGIKRMLLEQELLVEPDVIERAMNDTLTIDDCVLISGLLGEHYRKVNAEKDGEEHGV